MDLLAHLLLADVAAANKAFCAAGFIAAKAVPVNPAVAGPKAAAAI